LVHGNEHRNYSVENSTTVFSTSARNFTNSLGKG